jgi:hypothetical protein
MSIRPIDIKTNLMANNQASRIRETQKVHEAGLAENVKQHKDENEHKGEAVQKTEASEDKVIRKEDEEEEKKQKSKQQQPENQDKETEEHEESEKESEHKHPRLPDGYRGSKIDVKI